MLARADDLTDWHFAAARATASASSTAWKQQINEQIAAQARPAPPGPLEMEIGFRVGPARNWAQLWKPAIDALDPILGRTIPERSFHPRDDRLVRLGLHRLVDDAVDWPVELGVWWRQFSR